MDHKTETENERRVRILQEVNWQTAGLIEVLLESDAVKDSDEGSKLLSILLRLQKLNSVAIQAMDESDPAINEMEIDVFGRLQVKPMREAEPTI